jgi:hypothetical protein
MKKHLFLPLVFYQMINKKFLINFLLFILNYQIFVHYLEF